jgi:hypothetical protein
VSDRSLPTTPFPSSFALYAILSALPGDRRLLVTLYVAAGTVVLLASFYLPYHLTYTTSPRFAGVTVAAQVGQGLLHALVAGLGMACFLIRLPSRMAGLAVAGHGSSPSRRTPDPS